MDPTPRFRLRLFAQEFDLRPGVTRIGRSPACDVTIEDPAISREHAVIVVEGETATLRDLGSRNGVRVNGARVNGEVVLGRGDRIRIGNQDLVFGLDRRDSAVEHRLDVTETAEIDGRLTPVLSPRSTAWWLEIQTRLLEEAISSDQLHVAEAIMSGIEDGMRERLAFGEPYERNLIEGALGAALELAMKGKQPRWVELVFDMLRDFRVVPAPGLAARIEALPAELLVPHGSGRRLRGTWEDVPRVS